MEKAVYKRKPYFARAKKLIQYLTALNAKLCPQSFVAKGGNQARSGRLSYETRFLFSQSKSDNKAKP